MKLTSKGFQISSHHLRRLLDLESILLKLRNDGVIFPSRADFKDLSVSAKCQWPLATKEWKFIC